MIMQTRNQWSTIRCALISLLAAVIPAAAAESQDTDQAARPAKFQIEVWGGYATLDASDLNLAVSHDNGVQELLFDEKYPWLMSEGEITSWTRSGEGERRELSQVTPIGGRVKYHLRSWLILSLGYKYFSTTESESFDYEYSSYPYPGHLNTELIGIAPFSLSAKGHGPLVGVHLLKALSDSAGLEVFLAGGPLFVEARYEQHQTYDWWFDAGGGETPVFRSDAHRVEEGDGTGLALEVGGQLSFRLHKAWGIFLEAAYAYQKAGLSGSGSETRDGVTESWEGDWQVRQDEIVTPWGSRSLEFPTAFPGDGPDGGAVRDFDLDLSGFQLRLGVLLRF
jgi:hypothetical protein